VKRKFGFVAATGTIRALFFTFHLSRFTFHGEVPPGNTARYQ
jgi:hypothetical protein